MAHLSSFLFEIDGGSVSAQYTHLLYFEYLPSCESASLFALLFADLISGSLFRKSAKIVVVSLCHPTLPHFHASESRVGKRLDPHWGCGWCGS